MSTNRAFYLGYHVSASGGYMAMAGRAESLGANTFAFFTRNPRGGAALKADESDAAAFRAHWSGGEKGPLVAHAPYTLNPCSDKEGVREFARLAFTEDLARMELTPGCFYNFHPGSHVGQGTEAGIAAIAALLNEVLTPDMHTTVLLETMAGKGSEVGGRFEELREILDRVTLREKMGVCLDTCHVWDGGYDVEDMDSVLTEFDAVIGLSRLRAMHLNNSLNDRGSRKDRHAKLREGRIDPEALVRVVRHPALAGRPFILETPNDDAGYAAEIAWLRERWEAEA
ncbi:MAG: deoxyribonuclease IV [Oscillospiraceae bacterium]|nr:deoxyribonuclease IV [Oscillospiraceae bacterium]